jgi:porin
MGAIRRVIGGRPRALWRCGGWAALFSLALSGTLFAAEAQPDPKTGLLPESIAHWLPDKGGPSGTRAWLAAHGIFYNMIYTNDVLANVRGGLRQGAIDQGKLETILSIDLEKLAGVKGLSFYTNSFVIHNTGRIRRDYVGGINTIAAIEALPTVRLSELWLEQKFWDDKASLRFGQLAADEEFFYSELSELFLQSDWATITAVNLPSGGPAYPLSTPGVRLKVSPVKDMTFQIALYNGDPAGPGPGDEQTRNRYGLNFRVTDPPFFMAEAQFTRNQDKDDTGLASTLKLGGWGHVGLFEDQRYAVDGTLLADPLGSGIPVPRRGNSGVYAVIEQQLYRPRGGDAQSGISVFSRISKSTSDRNLVDFFVDGGIVFAGMVPNRPDDKFGASFIYTRFSDNVQGFDRDTIAFTGMPGVVRDFEANLEFTYQAKIASGWTVQPVLTYVWHPNGDASRNALVIGGRSVWRY